MVADEDPITNRFEDKFMEKPSDDVTQEPPCPFVPSLLIPSTLSCHSVPQQEPPVLRLRVTLRKKMSTSYRATKRVNRRRSLSLATIHTCTEGKRLGSLTELSPISGQAEPRRYLGR